MKDNRGDIMYDFAGHRAKMEKRVDDMYKRIRLYRIIGVSLSFVFVVLILCFSSCGHKIHEGEVVKKRFEPAHPYTYTTMIYTGKVSYMQVHTGYISDRWVIEVKGKHNKDTITESFCIDEDQWNCLNIGDHFNDTIPCTRYSEERH